MPIQVYQSNSVDVLGDDGLLRYGRVVDIADDGLFIDFLCPTRTREHTPFSSVYLPTSLEPLHMREIDRPRTVPTAPIPVEVLIRETPFDSWMWVPAKMESLVSYEAPALYGMALVRWWNKMQFEDIVPLERIRWRIPGPGGWWGALGMPAPSQFALTLLDCGEGIVEGAVFAQPDAVIKGKFSKWSMALPKELAVNGYILQRYNWELWMREPFCCVNFADGRLQCIERRTAAEKAEAVSEKEARYSNLEGATDSFDGVLGLMCSFYPNKCLLYVSTQDEAPVDEIDALTVEVWQEVFSHLETWDQNRLRTVCFAWNAILESSVITAQLVLKTTGYSGTFETSRTLVPCMMSTIFNCLRASTKHIILSDPERILYVEDLLQLLDVINYTGKRNTEVSVLAIWLVGCRCKFSLGMISYADECVVHHSDHSVNQFHGRCGNFFNDFIVTCGSLPCDRMRLVRCAVQLSIPECNGRYDVDLVPAESQLVLTAWLPLGDEFKCALWNALDMSLPVMDQQHLAKMKKKLETVPDFDWLCFDLVTMCRVLCATQTADPRPSSSFRGKKWCAYWWQDIQLEQLNRIALHFLTQLIFPQ